MVKILVKKFGKHIKLPVYKTYGSSGMDLVAYTKKKIIINPSRTAIIPTGIALAIPKNYEIQIRPRSGLAAKKGISVLNTPGTIDSDYRGEINVILANFGAKAKTIERGMRIAQLVIAPVTHVLWQEIETLPKSIRDARGFGSTGASSKDNQYAKK